MYPRRRISKVWCHSCGFISCLNVYNYINYISYTHILSSKMHMRFQNVPIVLQFLWIVSSDSPCHASITCDSVLAEASPVGLVTIVADQLWKPGLWKKETKIQEGQVKKLFSRGVFCKFSKDFAVVWSLSMMSNSWLYWGWFSVPMMNLCRWGTEILCPLVTACFSPDKCEDCSARSLKTFVCPQPPNFGPKCPPAPKEARIRDKALGQYYHIAQGTYPWSILRPLPTWSCYNVTLGPRQ